ncbi:motility associated factor glycosyltransferase family protein [Cohnella cholangitidis]|nr:6-hydroxymethylpterin diphosphokinase MptE-like protein [Cohnella cholangitidis]
MLLKNLEYLRANRTDLYQRLVHIDRLAQNDRLQIQSIEKSSPNPNCLLIFNQYSFHLHEPSDPWGEADRMLRTIAKKIAEKDHHLLFFGAGLAYHIRNFVAKHPDVPYSIYEPSPKVLKALLCEISLEDLNMPMLRDIYLGFDRVRTVQEIKSFINRTPAGFTIVTLPSYKKVFGDLNKQFIQTTQQLVKRKQQQMGINRHFEKKWVYNALRNFRYTLDAPSVFDFREHFENKPVLLVSAGPSLEEEIENIRKIKEQGLAYIFTAGSAINVFIEHQIVPDAAFTYDPGPFNRNAFTRAIQENKVPFPMVYGSTVGEGTLEQFPWSKVYIPITQDPMLAYYGMHDLESPVIHDAPSIAIVTLQVLIALKCSSIILVGQNFAFRDNQYYAEGVPYSSRNTTERIPVASVEGDTIFTNSPLNLMRYEMEHYINKNPSFKIINATKGGAAIKGAQYIPLSETISKWEGNRSVVDNWLLKPRAREMNLSLLLAQSERMLEQRNELGKLFAELDRTLTLLKSTYSPPIFHQFDNLFKSLQQNLFFRYFLQPMNRVGYEVLFSKTVSIKLKTDLRKKAELVTSLFASFLEGCNKDYNDVQPYFEELTRTIEQYAELKKGAIAK